MKKLITLLFLILVLTTLDAQVAPEKYFIEFTDKSDNPYSLDRPWEFLSDRSLQRRQIQGIALDEHDLPVTPGYAQGVAALGAQVITRSKWMNGVTVKITDPQILNQIEQLPYVKSVVKNGPYKKAVKAFSATFKYPQMIQNIGSVSQELPGIPAIQADFPAVSGIYGAAWPQIRQVGGEELHQMGYRGNGILIAVLDAGFQNVDILPAFDSLRLNGRIAGTYDFVEPGGSVYGHHPHGTMVLSIMGAQIPWQYTGVAPDAGYLLYRTEDAATEYIIEEYNWVCGAESADSAGADIINSSLGYTVFDDPSTDHTCADLDGQTTIVSRGANAAASRGILVCSSAGNSGNNPAWQCISAPSDGLAVMGVAAVDSNGIYASFSSKGKFIATRVKPDIAAMGAAVAVIEPYGSIVRGSGTSFSSPVIAGMAACLWQGSPGRSVPELTSAIKFSGSQSASPDTLTGYGIPDFPEALQKMGEKEVSPVNTFRIYPNPATETFSIFQSDWEGAATLEMYSAGGRIVYKKNVMLVKNSVTFVSPQTVSSGYYILKISSVNGIVYKSLLIK